jgi:hypothetical protein
MLGLPGLLNQTVSIYNATGQDRHGDGAFGVATNVKARMVPKSRTILQPNGTVVQIDALCYVKPETNVNINDKLIYDSNTYKVTGKDAEVNRNGSTHHWTLKLALWRT